ncbi:MAG: hypothetical protein MJ237_06045 [bacterium]|nr:hypothetical protein [bacterium]
MVRNLDAFKAAKEINDNLTNNELNIQKKILLTLIDEMNKFVKDVNDIADTYYAVKKIDSEYAKKLWSYLCQSGLTIDVNSYWGFTCAVTKYYYTRISVNPKGLCIYYDSEHNQLENWNELNWKGNNAKAYIENTNLSSEILENYINSTKIFLEKFPIYRDEFFKMVEQPNFK